MDDQLVLEEEEFDDLQFNMGHNPETGQVIVHFSRNVRWFGVLPDVARHIALWLFHQADQLLPYTGTKELDWRLTLSYLCATFAETGQTDPWLTLGKEIDSNKYETMHDAAMAIAETFHAAIEGVVRVEREHWQCKED
jgi:hypothetical protein